MFALARDRAPDREPEFAFAALWWSESGRTLARFIDVGLSQAWAGTWEIRPAPGATGRLMKAIGLAENVVTRTTEPAPLDYRL
jgi:hypothetical protein